VGAARILIVEDEQIVSLDLERRLRSRGYDVATAGGAAEALVRVAETPPDLVLMDVKLGDGDGIATVARIHETLDVPVVYVTAYADRVTVERAKTTEPCAYIVKPVDPKELDAAVWIGLYRGEAERRRRELLAWRDLVIDVGARLVGSLDAATVIRSVGALLVPAWADVFAVVYADPALGLPDDTILEPRDAVLELTPIADARERRVSVTYDAAGPAGRRLRCTPLVARHRQLGVMVMGWRTRQSRKVLAAELVDDIARRLASSLENGLLYREAQRAIASRDVMLSVVSHDLRNSIAIVSLAVDHLDRRAGDLGFEVIRRATAHIKRLIGDLLDAKAMELGRLSLQWSQEELGALVEQVVSLVRPAAAERDVELVVACDDAIMSCDRDRMIQVLVNLLTNAVKHSPPHSKVVLRAEHRPHETELSVRDAGVGIPTEELPHVFEYFWRSPRDRRGTGLGLYIAKAVVEAHGGRIWIESAVGRGTTVSFVVPRRG
jgi:signal transduction histidine kinase